MKTTLSERFTILCDGSRGVRALVQVTAREASPGTSSASEVQGTLPSSDDNPCLDFIASSATLDRFHEVIEPSGWRLDNYRKNPVFQNAHNYGDVIFTLGKAVITEVRSGAGGSKACLFQRIQFATDANPMARIAHGLYKGGFLNAVSVGFIPLRWEDGDARTLSGKESGSLAAPDSALPCRRRYLEQELLEVSAVAIPANPDALALGLKTGAIVKSDLQDTLDLLRQIIGAGAVGTRLSVLESQKPPISFPIDRPSLLSPELIFLAHELHRTMRRA